MTCDETVFLYVWVFPNYPRTPFFFSFRNGKCENTLGSFACLCDDGYSVSDAAHPEAGCVDEDECALDLYHCDPNAACTNTNGSYECACDEGYAGDGFECQVRKE